MRRKTAGKTHNLLEHSRNHRHKAGVSKSGADTFTLIEFVMVSNAAAVWLLITFVENHNRTGAAEQLLFLIYYLNITHFGISN
jgi:hypothetical protein